MVKKKKKKSDSIPFKDQHLSLSVQLLFNAIMQISQENYTHTDQEFHLMFRSDLSDLAGLGGA